MNEETANRRPIMLALPTKEERQIKEAAIKQAENADRKEDTSSTEEKGIVVCCGEVLTKLLNMPMRRYKLLTGSGPGFTDLCSRVTVVGICSWKIAGRLASSGQAKSRLLE